MQYELPLDNEATLIRVRRIMPASGSMSSRRERVNCRNKVMVARYYYWTEVRRRRFDDVMIILSEQEFFVEERTISNALLDWNDYLNKLYSEKASTRDLKKEYPNWNWETN